MSDKTMENAAPAAEEERVSRHFIEQEIDSDLEKGVYDSVHTRFPPEPNGYLHIGHAKSILLNYGMAQEYGGKFNLRFDDTNPTKEKIEFVESIKEDVHWLGADYEDRLFYASDYFQEMYDVAVRLIKKGKAYVSDLSAEQMREYRGTLTEPGKNDPNRDRSIEENLELFEKMRAGEFADGEKTLRAKIDMASPNINMRDPIIYRVAHMSHHNTGDAWCIYPMYDFAHPIEDARVSSSPQTDRVCQNVSDKPGHRQALYQKARRAEDRGRMGRSPSGLNLRPSPQGIYTFLH